MYELRKKFNFTSSYEYKNFKIFVCFKLKTNDYYIFKVYLTLALV